MNVIYEMHQIYSIQPESEGLRSKNVSRGREGLCTEF